MKSKRARASWWEIEGICSQAYIETFKRLLRSLKGLKRWNVYRFQCSRRVRVREGRRSKAGSPLLATGSLAHEKSRVYLRYYHLYGQRFATINCTLYIKTARDTSFAFEKTDNRGGYTVYRGSIRQGDWNTSIRGRHLIRCTRRLMDIFWCARISATNSDFSRFKSALMRAMRI